jgi:chromate transporter
MTGTPGMREGEAMDTGRQDPPSQPERRSLAELARLFGCLGVTASGGPAVHIAMMRHELVSTHHWLSASELPDAIAIGQVAPGPVFTTATFVGYLLAGVPGAAVATVAIFLPSFVMVAGLEPLVSRMRRSSVTSAALDGLNVAAAAALVVLLIWRPNRAWLVAGGIGVGLAAYLLGLPLAG